MNKDIAKLWIDELLSGRHGQTQNRLEDSYDRNKCCLGVLCFLAAKAGICDKKEVDANIYYDEEKHELPKSVQKWAGMETSNGRVKVPENSRLDKLNDAGQTFAQIAQVIAYNVETL